MKKQKLRLGEKTIEKVMLICAFTSVAAVLVITYVIFAEGIPLFKHVGVGDFLTGADWDPDAKIPQYGILPMITGSVYTTAIALVLGIPIGLGCAIFLAEIAPRKVSAVLRKIIEILAGIPSIVYGFFGLVVIVPFVRGFRLGPGQSVLAAGLILAIMILPTIITIAEVSMRAVPKAYKDGSLALGASQWQTIRKVSLPTARSGIIAGIVLGIGRAMGETMAVILVAGNTPIIPESIFQPVRTMTVNVVLDMSYAVVGSDHYRALFATAIALFIFTMIINAAVMLLSRKRVTA